LIEDNKGRAIVALLAAEGVVFYSVSQVDGSVIPVGVYPSKCKTLFVIGAVNDSLLISSDNDDADHTDSQENPNCPALGLGTIDMTPLFNSTTVTTVTVTPNTELFQYMDNFVWSDANKTLLVVKAFNVIANSTTNVTKTDFILGLSNGNFASPEILSQNSSFPFKFDWGQAAIFKKIKASSTNTTSSNTTSGNTTVWYIVGPVSAIPPAENDVDDLFLFDPNRVEIWNLTEPSFPQLVSTLTLKSPRRLDVNAAATALYVSVLGNATATSSNSTNSTLPTANDSLQIFDLSDVKSPTFMGEITYEGMLAAVQTKGATPDSTVTSTGGKRITAVKAPDDLLVGWNTGELGEWDLDTNPFIPEFKAYVSTLSVPTTTIGNSTAGSTNSTDFPALNAKFKGVSDITASKLGSYITFITAYDNTKGGSLFEGFKRNSTESD